VLARELGLKLDLADICLSPLLPAELAAGQWQDFWQQRELLDSQMLVLYQQAKANQQVLRYAACLSLQAGQIKAEVSLQAVALDAPLAALGPCDNIFVIESSWYHDNPLVLKGPGAGSIVTAGGLHADLAQLVAKLAG
jgi:aspartokinase/homoserine dehydrogenase 2